MGNIMPAHGIQTGLFSGVQHAEDCLYCGTLLLCVVGTNSADIS